MSQTRIVHLESYRGRREVRYRLAVALHGHQPDRLAILEHLWRALALVGADRAAVVWVDEYGPALARPHTLLDLAAHRPRRFFSPVPLRTAWETRVPGLLDIPQTGGRWERLGEGIASSCAIAIGSDGPRSWFLVLDSLTPRQPLTDRVAGELMFLAGEVSAVVLHRELDLSANHRSKELGDEQRFPLGAKRGSFSGWPVLKDLEGREKYREVSRKIGNRFLVARVVRGLVEDDLVASQESLCHQIDGVREELGSDLEQDPEAAVWDEVLRAAVGSDHLALTTALLDWGRVVEGQGHFNGATEILAMAFELAKATGSPDEAVDAARFQGKIFRTQAEWARALAWYDVARGVAEESGNQRKLAAVLDGLANAHRDRGNLPQAREVLQEVMEIGKQNGDRYALAIAHHDLMTVDRLGGDLVSAIEHGWLAVRSYESRDGRLRALFDLAGVLRESGELSAAWDAYSVVVHQVQGTEARILALDALAFVAALRGDRPQYEALRGELDAERWEEVPPVYRGQVLFYRGLSSRALGEEEEARAWLGKALAFAEEYGLNKLIFDSEAALEQRSDVPSSATEKPVFPDSPPEEILGVRQGLREMREALAGAGEPE